MCEFCAKSLEKVFLRRDEVTAINLNLTTKEILINLKNGASLDDATVESLISYAGLDIERISRKPGQPLIDIP